MNKPEHKPIKRSPYLAPLSREHHEGLLLVWKIKHGISKGIGIQRILLYVNWFFKEFLETHFKTEEETFSKILSPDNPLLLQMLQEHKAIEQALENLKNNTIHSEVQLLDFGTLIQLHIRFEERFLFNHIESILSPEELAKLEIEPHHTTQEYPDPFWI